MVDQKLYFYKLTPTTPLDPTSPLGKHGKRALGFFIFGSHLLEEYLRNVESFPHFLGGFDVRIAENGDEMIRFKRKIKIKKQSHPRLRQVQ